jgi:anti-anti-sigma regulatory factor
METIKLDCGQSLDVRQVASCREQWMAALAQPAPVSVEVGALTKVDTAGVQLLLSLEQECRLSGRDFRLSGESPELDSALALLGFPGWGQ